MAPARAVAPGAAAAKRAATGSLLGLALGDALGFPAEFNDVPSILGKFGPWREMELQGKPGAHGASVASGTSGTSGVAFVSDDTQMTLALGRGLRTALSRGPLGPRRMERPVREEFVDWYHSPDNNRAPGRTCLVACRLLDSDLPWQKASQIGSKGCGANMRVAPVGLVPGLSEGDRAGAAQLQAALTHGHPTGLAASDLTARAVHLLAQGVEPTGLVGQLRSYALESRSVYQERWLGDLWTYSQDPTPRHFAERGWDECLGVLERLEKALRDPSLSPETDPCLVTGDGWIAEEALATALLCFLMFPDEPVTALRRAACTQGDSDSIACLTGAFAGAYAGVGAWPAAWVERVEYREELVGLGEGWDGGV